MLLQVMTDTRNISIDLVTIGKPHTRNLAQCRVGLLRRGGLDLSAYAALLRRPLQRRRTYLIAFLYPRIADQLIYRRHMNSRRRPFCPWNTYRLEPALYRNHTPDHPVPFI